MYIFLDVVHEENKDDNDDCYTLLFGMKCTNQWQALKTLYICTLEAIKIIVKTWGRKEEL